MIRVSQILSLLIAVAVASLILGQATGQQATESGSAAREGSSPKRGGGKNKPTPMNVTPEREAAVRTFVELNHAELADLLAHLKANQPKEYERAVRELHRVTERLAGIQERDPTQYDLEVKFWTAQSRVQLFTAKLRMGTSEDIKDQLREALGAQAEAKVALLKHDRSKIAERLSRVERDIAQFENEREKVIEKQLELLVRTAKQGKDVNFGGKAAANKPAGKRAKANVAAP